MPGAGLARVRAPSAGKPSVWAQGALRTVTVTCDIPVTGGIYAIFQIRPGGPGIGRAVGGLRRRREEVHRLVIGLTLQNSLGQIISGLLMLFEQPFRIGYFGRLVESKGILDLLAAFARLPHHTRLTLIGSGDLDERITATIERLEITPVIRMRLPERKPMDWS